MTGPSQSGAYVTDDLAPGDPCPLACPGRIWLDQGFLTCSNCMWNSEEGNPPTSTSAPSVERP